MDRTFFDSMGKIPYFPPRTADHISDPTEVLETITIPGPDCSYVFDRCRVRNKPGGPVAIEFYTGPEEAFAMLSSEVCRIESPPTWEILCLMAEKLDQRRRENLFYMTPAWKSQGPGKEDSDLPGDAWMLFLQDWEDEDADA